MGPGTPDKPTRRPLREIFTAFARLGLTAFGGPVAHLSYFRDEFVTRRRWLPEKAYADLVALCQFLPGPASSQVGMGIGLSAGGLPGALAAWAGFTLPSALAMAALGLLVHTTGNGDMGALRGLMIVAVAVVANALLGMAKSLCPNKTTKTIALGATATALLFPGVAGQLAIIILSAVAGKLFVTLPHASAGTPLAGTVSRHTSICALGTFLTLLFLLPLLAQFSSWLSLADSFYRAGSLVFGGGHVVLPLLRAETVPDLIGEDAFLSGYGAAQAVPGPLFTFSSYLGAADSGILGAAVCLVAVFLPSFLLIVGILPFWQRLTSNRPVRAAAAGANAAVVGLLAAAFYAPVFTGAVDSPADLALAVVAFSLLAIWKAPSWAVVLLLGTGYATVAGMSY